MISLIADDKFKAAAKAVLTIVKEDSLRHYGSIAKLEANSESSRLIATDGYRILIYPLETIAADEPGSVCLSFAALKAIASLKKGGPVSGIRVTTDTTEIETRQSKVSFKNSAIPFPEYKSALSTRDDTFCGEMAFTPAFLEFSYFPEKSVVKVFSRNKGDLFEFTDGKISYFLCPVQNMKGET